MKNPKPKKPLISVVIPAYNEERLIKRCLFSLLNQTFARDKYEIIVVNNASTDKTGELASQYADRVINEPKKGLIPARQAGFKVARGKIILRTDADAFVPIDWIERAWFFFEKHPQAVALGGFYLPDTQSLVLVFHSWLVRQFFHCQYKIFGSVNWLSGPCSAFNRDSFNKIGGFDMKIDPSIADQISIAHKMRQVGKIGFDKDWWVWFSMRRAKKRSLKDIINYYVLYLGLNALYFMLFKKQPKKLFGKGWEDIRD